MSSYLANKPTFNVNVYLVPLFTKSQKSQILGLFQNSFYWVPFLGISSGIFSKKYNFLLGIQILDFANMAPTHT